MRFIKMLGEILSDLLHNIKNEIVNNLINVSNVLSCTLPYLMCYIGIKISSNNEMTKFEVLCCVLLTPIFYGIIIWLLRRIADKSGKGKAFPIPNKRFTECDEYGEVSVEQDRLQEMLLYVADVEDWLDRRGLL